MNKESLQCFYWLDMENIKTHLKKFSKPQRLYVHQNSNFKI